MLFAGIIWGVVFALSVSDVAAQVFSVDTAAPVADKMVVPAGGNTIQQGDKDKNTDVNSEVENISNSFVSAKSSDDMSTDPLSQISNALNEKGGNVDGVAAAKAVEETTKEEEIFIPEGELYKLNEEPTFDGSVRGGQAFVEVDEKGRMKKVSNIFLFFDKFKVSNYLSNSAMCDVRFNVLSNLDRKINQLDVKLVWPDLTTTLSFKDVMPNTQTYYNYSLLGKGCYNMDKAPNIVVNRCRVRGMTSRQCADKLIWLSK